MHKNIRPILFASLACLMALVFTACDTDAPSRTSEPGSINPMRYDPLRVGDEISITLNAGINPPLPAIVTEIKGDGTISLPDLGSITALNKTPGDLENEIRTNYVPAYYTRMSVTVAAMTRYIFVGGEVNMSASGGKQPYTGPITVTQAIRAAGDFNPFARKKRVQLRRAQTGKTLIVNCVKAIDHPELDLWVYPGDTIYVPRRVL